MPVPKYPPMTWPDGATPTTAELRAWLHLHQPGEHDARVAADMILGMLEGEQAGHRMTRASWRMARAAADRYRLAWLSARRRARAAYEKGSRDGYLDGMLEA